MHRTFGLLVVLFLLAPRGAPVLAQEADGVVAETFVAAVPLEPHALAYPREALIGGGPKEAWKASLGRA